MNPDRRESDLAANSLRMYSSSGVETTQEAMSTERPGAADDVKYRRVNLWWYVMLLALVVALAETTLASRYMGTQREEA